MRQGFIAAAACLAACTPAEIAVKRSTIEALATAEARLAERGIDLDPAGRRADRLRTGHFCHQAPGVDGHEWGREWDRSFAHPVIGPLPYTEEGGPEAQVQARERCPRLFRVEIVANPLPDGGSRVAVIAEWWKVTMRGCVPIGDPLLGHQRCEYAYTGATGEGGVERFVYGMLGGL